MTIPSRIARLEKDSRGYPIPWNVLRGASGEAFFTVNDDSKHWRALREVLCPICGERLGNWKWFVGGPRSAFDPNGWYLDLPGHRECIEFSLKTCPYLSAPKYLGRLDVPARLAEKLPTVVLVDETQIPERPEIFVAVASNSMQVLERGLLLPYVRPGKLLEIQYWRAGERIPENEGKEIVEKIMTEKERTCRK